MAGFKRSQPGLAFASEKVTPDEIDMYRQYIIAFPAVATGLAQTWYFLGTSGTADTVAITPLRVIADYPRSLEFSITGSSVGMAGSVDVNGRDQFGVVISETI